MWTAADYCGVLVLFYFALVIPASIGVFAQGATGVAVFIVLGIAAPLAALFLLAGKASVRDGDTILEQAN